MASYGDGWDEKGHGRELLYTGIEGKERAEEIKRALHRCAYWMHRQKVLSSSMSVSIESLADGSWQVRYKAISKEAAYRYMLEKYGDPSEGRWPYNPFKRGQS
jgi:hypothetical protein